jgi:hypothetical protein
MRLSWEAEEEVSICFSTGPHLRACGLAPDGSAIWALAAATSSSFVFAWP